MTMVVATAGLLLFAAELLVRPSYCTRTGKTPVGNPCGCMRLVERGMSTLICHKPGNPGARPEYFTDARLRPMYTTGTDGVEMAPEGGTPSPGAPGINPCPVR